jgi:hypothetical protein
MYRLRRLRDFPVRGLASDANFGFVTLQTYRPVVNNPKTSDPLQRRGSSPERDDPARESQDRQRQCETNNFGKPVALALSGHRWISDNATSR